VRLIYCYQVKVEARQPGLKDPCRYPFRRYVEKLVIAINAILNGNINLLCRDLISRALSRFTWSFIRAIRGVITRQIPSLTSAGTWNVIDFPPPVGISPRVSFPSAIDLIISSCKGLKDVYPQYLVRICLYGSIFIQPENCATYKNKNCNSIFYKALLNDCFRSSEIFVICAAKLKILSDVINRR
jgi:hypothetical protein